MLKKITTIAAITITTHILNSCALVSVPVKVAGKVATTSLGVAGKMAGAGIDAVTPNSSVAKPTEEN